MRVGARKAPNQSAPAGGLAGSATYLLSKIGFEATQRFRSMLEPLGLEPRQFALLRHVAGSEGQTQQALGDALGIPKSRMVALIDDLEERGLVERRLRPDDRRARALHVTPEGARCLNEAMEVANAHEAFVRERLSPAEHRQLVGLLQRLAEDQDLEVHPGLRSDYEPRRRRA
jgi:DNA-binding MarR family transcriptional regulator